MKYIPAFLLMVCSYPVLAQQTDSFYVLKPDRVFDGEAMHEGWNVLVHRNKIEAAGDPATFRIPKNSTTILLPGTTLLPGFIEGHSHLFLHPYNETPWNDQVLNESRAERTARAVNLAKATLLAGFTTVRDLGTEGALYDDAGLKLAIEKGVVPGPRMIIATRAIVAQGTYGPKSANVDVDVPQGAAEVAGSDQLIAEVRLQLGKGADVIKLYGDYRWGKDGEALPTFTITELKTVTELVKDGGRTIAIHAATAEGMRHAALAGVTTIEHGDGGTADVFKLMNEKGVALCPTLSAGEAVLQYNGWRKGLDPEPQRIAAKKKSFTAALQSGVRICFGGDVGVYTHGDNAREMERMVEYGMQPLAVIKSATAVNADVFGYANKFGRIKTGLFADIIAVQGNPAQTIAAVRHVIFIMKDGVIYKNAK